VFEMYRGRASSPEASRLPPVAELAVVSVRLTGAVDERELVVKLAGLPFRGEREMGVQDHVEAAFPEGQDLAGAMGFERCGGDGCTRKKAKRERCRKQHDPDHGGDDECCRPESPRVPVT
jgi:hypothetical protein